MAANSDLTADDIPFGTMSMPMPAAVKTMGRVMSGEAPDDELRDTDTSLAAGFALAHADRLQFDFVRRHWMVNRNGLWRSDPDGEASRLLQEWTEQRVFEEVGKAANRRDMNAVRRSCRRALSAQ